MRRALDAVGRGLITVGLLLLAFVAYQIFGTDLIASRGQAQLRHDFEAAIARGVDSPQPVLPGDAVARLTIPDIGMRQIVVEGVDASDLRRGPGHYPGTPIPGRAGNAAIAGHRTTSGAPFNDLGELEVGDRIEVETVEGEFVYRVREQLVVAPTTVEVLEPAATATLTLTTCHPKYSARQRLVVVADLDRRASDAATEPVLRTVAEHDDLDAGEPSGWDAVDLSLVVWSLALGLTGAGWWFLHRGRRHWSMTLVGALPFLFVLFFFFGEVEELLPANF